MHRLLCVESGTSSLTTASGYSSEVSLGSFPKHSAHDLISVARANAATELSNDKEDVFIVDKIATSDELTLPVAHFAVLVRLISKSKELYHPQNQNCYEFSAAIVECVLRGCPSHWSFARQQVTNHRLRGRFRTMDVSTPSKISSPETINKLYAAWRDRHDTIDRMLSSAERDERNNQLTMELENEVKGAEDEAKRADNEKARADWLQARLDQVENKGSAFASGNIST
ncbi:hypothetical protein PILCRDRAFT_328508 [Piloderma croceum F 1598]|uniref:Uncharacterized protein n=1 Tax=Piloderma croceum (strain F 1598) TaxID=765440 RepID=A0A0C3C863_PILCF|nr:hypothetical protein PILCRDRAFT_328508 [Piloderma croceum F 1598]